MVINTVEEAEKIDVRRPIYLFAQTTMTIEGLQRLQAALEQRRCEQHIGSNIPFQVNDTVCRQVAGREPHLAAFARRHSVAVFVSGNKSSNGKALYEVCRRVNPRSYHVTTSVDIKDAWFVGAATVGICGATSTPRWLMEEVAISIEN
jgi:4-hydroxy-3-methylbut-2-enyl diphosphate reductase